MVDDVWAAAAAYEAYIGRWSREAAAQFVGWLGVRPGELWADVGCGTGALTAAVLAAGDPARVAGVDPSAGFAASALAQLGGARAEFCLGDAMALPLSTGRFGAVVSGLALNFVPDPRRAATELARVTAPAGVTAAYVWDYAGGMEMLRYFWDAAAALDPAAVRLDEGRRFPLCEPGALRELWTGAGLDEVAVRPIDVATMFANFTGYWEPFLGGQGPAPGYVATLDADHRDSLRELLRSRLPGGPDGTIRLTARAWAVRGTPQMR
jgi:SAM-dependent methyltransferase